MIKQISLLCTIILLLFISSTVESVQALSCELVSVNEAIAHADTILQARITDATYADGKKYGNGDYREDPLYMRAEVSQVWRGQANATEVIVFSDPEWGGVPRAGQDYIFYLSRRDSVLNTGNCVRLTPVNTAEIHLIEAIIGEGAAPTLGEMAEMATYFPSETVGNGILQPIALGPGPNVTASVTSAGALPFNLLCLLLLVVAALAGQLMKNSRSEQEVVKSDPVK